MTPLAGVSRREFLTAAGLIALVSGIPLAGCSSTVDGQPVGPGITTPDPTSDHGAIGSAKGMLAVFGSSGSDSVTALHADSGTLAWQYRLGDNTGLTSAAAGPHGLYLLDDDGYLHLVSTSGSRVARIALPQRGPPLVSTTPLVLGDQVFVNNWDAAMYAYAADDLTERTWRYNTTDDMELRTSPAGTGHTVFLGTDNGWVLAVSDADGRRSWDFHAKAAVGSPAVGGSSVVVPIGHLGLLALDAGSGDTQWFLDDGWYSTPQVSGDHLLVGHGTAIEALSMKGDRLWSTEVLVDHGIDGPPPAPGAGGGLVFTAQQKFTATGSADTSVFTGNPQALDAATGRRRWIRNDVLTATGARYVDGLLYLGLSHPQSGGRPNAPAVACLDARTGRTLWQHDTDGYPSIEPLLVTGG